MALRPGDQDGVTGIVAGSAVPPIGSVVRSVQCIATPGGAGCTVDVSDFEPSKGPVFVPGGAGYSDRPDRYVGDGVKAIRFAGTLDTWDVSWAVF